MHPKFLRLFVQPKLSNTNVFCLKSPKNMLQEKSLDDLLTANQPIHVSDCTIYYYFGCHCCLELINKQQINGSSLQNRFHKLHFEMGTLRLNESKRKK